MIALTSEQREKYRSEVNTGEHAKRLLEDEYLQATFAVHEAEQFKAIIQAESGDTETLVNAKALIDAGRNFQRKLTNAVERGTVAYAKLEAAKGSQT